MKALNLLTLTIVTGTLLTLSSTAPAGILETPHDFSGESWNNLNNNPSDPASVCGSCHTPHNADSTVAPLWSHATTTANFEMYITASQAGLIPGSDMQATGNDQPAGVSKACLSCHDGTVALNTYGGTIANRTTHGPAERLDAGNPANLGINLTHTHPISLDYTPAITGDGPTADKWLFNPDTTQVLTPDSGTFVSGNNMTINSFLLGNNNRLECSSCHDVHNQEGTPFDINTNPKLVKILGTQGGKGSLLCRSCHNK